MINSYDIDGVINMGDYVGLRPGPEDVIITGRSWQDERFYTSKWLTDRKILNDVYYSPFEFNKKTRENSGVHKARTLNDLLDKGFKIGLHFEDDPIQADYIERWCPRVKVVRIVHDLVEKENVWHGPTDNQSSTRANS